ncbi:hypothetical protein BOTBODRAFT_123337 [Botryobasidium botryosum FD-172 SS1]|uniref:Cytochrome P450 n=1 Tax=Botryobasidium botryosum (strain FD-172 SS1) TaxID=930990 RepID=A0A067N0K9_BOTB1|nr:hypothetical protein BOTBODRAFT_123337 [Botryobasidium botryosum FD-172 SS1]
MGYRLVYLATLSRVFALPPLALFAFSRAFPHLVPAHWIVRYFLYVLSIPVVWGFRTAYHISSQATEAKRLGAEPIPVVRGKWPGNIDISQKMINSLTLGYAGDPFGALFDEYGCHTLNLRILWRDRIITRDHLFVKRILATGFDDFNKGPSAQYRANDLFGTGIFNRNGDAWKYHRSLTKPFFARDRVNDFDTFERGSKKLLKIIRAAAAADEAIEVQDLYGRFTIDAAAEFLFGTPDLNSLDGTLPKAGSAVLGPKGSAFPVGGSYEGFLRAFEGAQVAATKRARCGDDLWPLYEFTHNNVKAHMDVIHEWLSPLIQNALENKQRREKEGLLEGESESLLDHLVKTTSDPIVIRDELHNILLAARDTTATLLTFATYLLSLHPEVVHKLREEISSTCDTNSLPTFEIFRKMPYLRAVLNETLRLFPPVAANERASAKAQVYVPQEGPPLYIPGPDVSIGYFPIHFQRRKDLWGEDAEEFKPERWIDEASVASITADPFKFLPFNAGPRICLGQNFAYNEASYVLVRLLQSVSAFELMQDKAAPAGSLPPEIWKQSKGRRAYEKIWPQNAINLFVKGGLWMKVKLAED